MDLGLTDEQAAVEELFAEFFLRECPIDVVRRNEQLGFAPEVWARLRETGGLSMGVGDAHGGGGAGLLELAIAAEQYGRHLAPVPFIDHVVAVRTLERLTADHGVTLPAGVWDAVLDGSEIAALAVRPVVDGVARLVPAGAVSRYVIAFDRDREELVLFDGVPPKVALANLGAQPLAHRAGAADGDATTVLVRGDAAGTVFAAAVDEWRVLTAAALVGLSEAALAIGVEYVKTRHQFDVPVGSFQAIQHGLADLPGRIAGARLLAARAAWSVDGGRTDDPTQTDPRRQAPMALIFAAELAAHVTAKVVHYHGGYGVMEEQDAQLYYRRAKGWPQVLADSAVELGRLATVVLDDAESGARTSEDH